MTLYGTKTIIPIQGRDTESMLNVAEDHNEVHAVNWETKSFAEILSHHSR